MAIPAILIHDHDAGVFNVAGLTLLERLIVAAHRAGCGPIMVVTSLSLPPFRRVEAMGIKIRISTKAGHVSEPTLVAKSQALVQPNDLKRAIQQGGHLVTDDGQSLPIGVVTDEVDLSQLCRSACFDLRRKVRAEGVAALVTDEASRLEAERRLWVSLTSSTDGKVDVYFNRPVGRYLSKLLVHTAITPNQVTILSMLIGLSAAWLFLAGSYAAAVVGALLLQLSAIVDCVDGDIARVLFKESPIGKWLDITVDQIVHMAVFAAIAVGLARRGNDAPELALGISAVVGVVISFSVVLRGMLRPSTVRSALLERFIDAAASRDFSVVLLALAVTNRLEWFLWAAGIGVHCFWITALLLQLAPVRRAQSAASPGR